MGYSVANIASNAVMTKSPSHSSLSPKEKTRRLGKLLGELVHEDGQPPLHWDAVVDDNGKEFFTLSSTPDDMGFVSARQARQALQSLLGPDALVEGRDVEVYADAVKRFAGSHSELAQRPARDVCSDIRASADVKGAFAATPCTPEGLLLRATGLNWEKSRRSLVTGEQTASGRMEVVDIAIFSPKISEGMRLRDPVGAMTALRNAFGSATHVRRYTEAKDLWTQRVTGEHYGKMPIIGVKEVIAFMREHPGEVPDLRNHRAFDAVSIMNPPGQSR